MPEYSYFSEIEKVRAARLMQRREQAAETVGRTTNQDFINFKSYFLIYLEQLKQKLYSVFTVKQIDLDELYDMRNAIFSSMDYEMDAILYLNAVYSSDQYIVEHCMRVGLLANIFARWLELDEPMVRDATLAGFIHDIGMLEIPNNIISKEGDLSQEEYETIKSHPVRGAMVVTNKGIKPEILEVIRSHHERYNGSGYPNGKKRNEISYLTALISIVDVYDSMTSNRPYSLAICPFEVIGHLEKNMIDQFDPRLLYIFLENIPYMYKNALVKLSNGDKGRVVFINKNNKTSPIVQLEKNREMVDLSTRSGLKIASLL